MANVFNFGIGLTAYDDASGAINGVIMSLENLEERLTRIRDLTSGMGGADTGELENSLAGISGTGMGGVIGGAVPDMEEAGEVVQQIAGDVRLATNQLDDLLNGLEFIAQIGLQVRDNLARVPPVMEQTADASAQAADEIRRIPPAAREAAYSFMVMHWHAQALIDDLISLQQAATSAGLSSLERDAVRLTAQIGESRESAMQLGDAVLNTARRTAVSSEAVQGLAVALGQTGARFEEFSSADQDALAHLTETFGMSADATVALVSGLKATGGSLRDTLADAVNFQKNFGVPGLIEQLPETIEAVIDAQARFSSLTRRSAASITKDITKMSAIYSKALGKSGAEAARLARESFLKFAGEVEAFEDVFLGLADDFSPLQNAFLETGMSLEDMEALMRKAAKAPDAFAQEVLSIRESMDPAMGEYFFRQVLRNVDEGTARLLTQHKALATATGERRKQLLQQIEDEKTAAEKQEAFNKLVVGMRNTAVDAAEMFQKLLGLFEKRIGFSASDIVRMGFEKLIRVVEYGLDIFDKVKGYFESKGGLSDGFKDAASTAVALGSGFGVMLPALRVLLGPLGGVFKLFGSIWKVGKFLGKTLDATSRGTGRLGKIFRWLAPGIGKIIWPIQAVLGAFEGVKVAVGEIGSVLSDPNKTGWEKFEGIIGGVFKGIVAFADKLLFGLPSMFIEGFKKMGQGVSTEGAASVGQAIGQLLGKAATMLADFASTTLPDVGRKLMVTISAWWTKLPEVGRKLMDTISAWWANIDLVDFGLKIVGGLAAIGKNIIAFAKGAAESFLAEFGLPLESIPVIAEITWLKIKKGLTLFVGNASDLFFGLGNGIQAAFNNVGAWLEAKWAGIAHSVGKMFRNVIARLIESFADFVEGFVKLSPRVAGFLGVTEDSVSTIRAAAAGIAAVNVAKEEEYKAELRRIEESRRADAAAIAERQRLNEETTKRAGQEFDEEIRKYQEELNQMAAARANARAELLPATAAPTAPSAVDLAVPPPPAASAPTASPTDVAGRAEGAGRVVMSDAQFNALLAALKSMQGNTHMAAHRQAIEVTLRHAAAGNTHFQRALEEGLNAVVEAER